MEIIGIGGVSVLIAVALHALFVRWLPRRFYISSIVLLAIFSIIITIIVAIRTTVEVTATDYFIIVVLTFSMMMAYALFFMGIAWDSPTIALLNTIENYGCNGMPVEVIEDFIRHHPFVESRIEALIESAVLGVEDDDFVVRRDVGALVKFAEFYRRLSGQSEIVG